MIFKRRGSAHHLKVRFFVFCFDSDCLAFFAANVLYISECVCPCVREKRIARENRDRHSANGISSPVSIKIFVLKNQCPYSVDYGFLKHSYTLCQLVECVLVCVRCHCNESLYKLLFATCLSLLKCGVVFSPTERHTRAAPAHEPLVQEY